MNKIIEEQLKKISIADLSNFDYDTNTYHIKRYTKPKYNQGYCYMIKIPYDLINNQKSILAMNWNNGTAPQFEYLKIYVNKTLGKMVYVDSIGHDRSTGKDINIMWSGWLDSEEIVYINQI